MPKSPYARLGTTATATPDLTQLRHIVRGGDKLSSIAAYYAPALGYSAEYWRQIGEANSIDDLDFR